MTSPKSEKDILQEAIHTYYHVDKEQAVLTLKELLETHPSFEDAYEALSVILFNQKKHDDSLKIIAQWIRLNPKSIMARTNQSRALAAKGLILEAEQAQSEARKLTWESELKSKRKEAPKNYQDLIERYKKVIALDPADVLGYFSLGQTYLEMELWRDAYDIFEKAISIQPNHSSSYLGWATASQKLGDKIKAKKILEDGILIANKNGDVASMKKMEGLLKDA